MPSTDHDFLQESAASHLHYVRRSSQLRSSNLIDEFLGLTVKRVITLTVAAIFDLSIEANLQHNNRPSGSASLAALYSLDEDKM